MSTLEMRLRDGLTATALTIAADPASKSHVISRGHRKRNIRRAIGSIALASVAAVGTVAMPRLGGFTESRIAPAGGGSAYQVPIGDLTVTTTVPRGWEARVETPEAVVLTRAVGHAGIAVFTPRAVDDPESVFGYSAPGPLVLATWARSLELEETSISSVTLGGAATTAVSGTAGSDGLALARLPGDYDLVLPPNRSATIHALNDESVLVVMWGEGPELEEAAGILAGLSFRGVSQ